MSLTKRIKGDYTIESADSGNKISLPAIGGVVIDGDLTVTGTTTTSGEVEITDNTIVLNSGATGPGIALGVSGIEIDRGSLTNTGIRFSEALGGWEATDDGSNWYPLNFTTLDSLLDVVLTASANNELLMFDGTNWVNQSQLSISHLNISDIGTNSHIAIDDHIADGTIHFSEASIDHANILSIGTNSHIAIDDHIADGTIHFTQAAISITESQIIDLQPYLLNVVEDLTPKLGGPLQTQNNTIVLEDSTLLEIGRVGVTATDDGVFFARTTDSVYNPADGGILATDGALEIHGAVANVQTLVGTGNRQVFCTPEGDLYSVVPPTPGFSVSDTDIGDYTMPTLGVWVKMVGLEIALPADVALDEPLQMFANIHIVNTSKQSGDVSFSYGVNGATPAGVGASKSISGSFDNLVPISITTSTHGGLLAGDLITIWVQKTTTSGTFAPSAIGSSAPIHELTVSTQAAGGGGSVTNPMTVDLDTGGFNIVTASSSVSPNSIRIVPGDTTGTGFSSHVIITGGAVTDTADPNTNGGWVDITGGYAYYGYGGGVSLQGGDSEYHNGGAILLRGGEAANAHGTAPYRDGGAVTIYGGDVLNSGYGGNVNIAAGEPGNGADGPGTVNIRDALYINSTTSPSLILKKTTGTSTISISSTLAVDTTFTLPPTDGLAGEVLTLTAPGVTSWAAGGGGGVTNPMTVDLDTGGFKIKTANVTGTATNNASSISMAGGNNDSSFGGRYAGGVSISGGDGLNYNAGGTIIIRGGTTDSYYSGHVALYGGSASLANGKAGNVYLIAGDCIDRYAGNINLKPGNSDVYGKGVVKLYGNIDTGGFNIVTADWFHPSDINIFPGSSNDGTYNGGAINITGGSCAVAGVGVGGSIQITPGNNIASALPGTVDLHSPDGAVGDASMRIWKDTDAAHTTGFYTGVSVSSTLAVNTSFVLPPTDGLAGEVLTLTAPGVTSWAASAGGGATILNDLTDVTLTTPAIGELLTFDGSIWQNQLFVALQNVVEDTAPKLGGDLDPNSFNIQGPPATTSSTLTIRPSDIISGGNTAGNLSVQAGGVLPGGTTPAAGDLYLSGGVSQVGTGVTTGGQVDLAGGAATSIDGIGGDVNIRAGTGGAAGGSIIITPGDDSTDNSADGSIILVSTGSGSTLLKFRESAAGGQNYVALRAPQLIGADRSWLLPIDDPIAAAGQFLTTDSAGTLSFAPGVSALTDLTDVTITTLAATHALITDDGTTFVNRTLTNADVGLGNVDNTSDLLKPISTATQTALDLKTDKVTTTVAGNLVTFSDTTGTQQDSGVLASSLAPLASPALTGTPTAPTASAGDSTTQLATTAFVSSGLALKEDGLGTPTNNGDVLSSTIAGVRSWAPSSDLGEFTIATLPTASTHANSYAVATDATGGPTVVRSNGTNWLIVAVLGGTVV